MVSVLAAVTAVHLLFGALWAGGVVFVVWRVLPLVSAGELSVDPARRIASGTQWLTRASAVVMLLTGGHMAATLYDTASLTGTGRGHVVVTMTVLWLAMTGLVEAGFSRYTDALDSNKIRTAGRESRTLLRAAGAVGVVLLVLGGWLAATGGA
ncbi:MAG: CopD family protein [Halolamina sp.]